MARSKHLQHADQGRHGFGQFGFQPAQGYSGADAHAFGIDGQLLQFGNAIQGNEGLFLMPAATHLDSEVGGTGYPRRIGMRLLEPERLIDEERREKSRGHLGRCQGRTLRRKGQAVIAHAGLTQALHGATDRQIAGASAQIALDGVIVELTFVATGKQAHHESGRAIAALRCMAIDHGLLYRMQGLAIGQMLHADHFAAGQEAERQQAAVDRAIAALSVCADIDQGHRASTAVAIGAAFLGTVAAGAVEPAQQRKRRLAARQVHGLPIQLECAGIGHCGSVAQARMRMHA